MNWTSEQIEAIRRRNQAGESLAEIGASLTPPITRQRLSQLLTRPERFPKQARVTLTISLPTTHYRWLLKEANATGRRKKSFIIQRLVEAAMNDRLSVE